MEWIDWEHIFIIIIRVIRMIVEGELGISVTFTPLYLLTMTIKMMNFFFSLKQFILFFFFHSISPSTTQGDLNISAMPCIEFKFNNNNNNILTSNLSFGTKFSSIVESEASSTLNSLVSTNAPLQTTLVSVCVIFNSFFFLLSF